MLLSIEVLHAMRRTPGLESVPVVLMSSIAPGVRREDYHWQAFLRKPFGLETLTRTVEQWVGRSITDPQAL